MKDRGICQIPKGYLGWCKPFQVPTCDQGKTEVSFLFY